MAILSIPKFAELAGVTKRAAYKARDKGIIVVRPDNKVDTSNPVNQDYIRKHQGQKEPTPTPKTTPSVHQEQELTLKQNSINLSGISQATFDEFLSQLSAANRQEVETLKILEQIKKERIKSDKERNDLIPREFVAKFFGKLYAIDVQELRTLGPNLAPEIAAIAGIDDDGTIIKIEELIEKEVFVVLGHIKRTINDDLLKKLEEAELE